LVGRPPGGLGLVSFFSDAAEAVEHRAGVERLGGLAKKGGGVARALARTAKLKAAIMSTPPSAPAPVWRRESR